MAMSKSEAMKLLKSMGTAQNRKIYARHFGPIEMFGVSYANLGKLRRQIKTDQKLAEGLWSTGNHDARVLATMIADPQQATATMLDRWVKECSNRGDASALSNLAATAPTAVQRVAKWTKSRNEWVACAGWHTLASLARDEASLADELFIDSLATIEASIDRAKNYARYAMNNALIAIGSRNARLRKLAIAAAKRIGVVDVDHGETSCKTPDAVTSIQKAAAHRAQKKADTKKANKKASRPASRKSR